MSNEISLVDDAAKRLRDRMRQVLMESVSDEQMDKLIESEHKAFFENIPETRDRWGNWQSAKPSPFSLLVRAELEKQMRPKVEQAVNAYIDTEYKDNGYKITKAVVDQMAPRIFQALIEGIAENALRSLKFNVGGG